MVPSDVARRVAAASAAPPPLPALGVRLRWPALAVAASLIARLADAQAVSGIDDETVTLPGGVVRFSASESDTRYDARYGTGGLRPLGADLSVDSLNASQLPILAPLQTSLRALTQNPGLDITLGETQVTSSVRVTVTPLGLDIGIAHWLMLRATVPIVRTHTEILFNPNPGGRTGNVGLNPALGIPGALGIDTAIFGQFSTAGASLQAALAACQANPGVAPYCPALNAQSAAALALIAQSGSFATALAKIYGGGGHTPAPIVPVDQSGPWNAITGRFNSFASAYAHFDSLTGGPGIAGPGPIGAPPLGLADAQTLLTTNLIGLGLDSLQSVTFVHLGDIELGATALLLDSFHGNDSARIHPSGFNYRLAATGIFRLGTGSVASPDNLVAVGTGTGANAVEVHAASDLLFGHHFWTSIIVRGTMPFSDRVSARIPLGLGDEFAPAFARQSVERTLGRTIDVELDPRYAINDYFGIVTQYRYLRHMADKYSGVFSIDSATTGFGPVALDASTLGAGTATTEQRWGVGLTFSSVAGASRHRSRIPFDISYFHYQTLIGMAGLGGSLPRQSTDVIQARLYTRLFGSGGAFKH